MLPVLFAAFAWWFVTGLIFLAYGRSRRVTTLFFLGASVVMMLALAGFVYAGALKTVAGVYLSLICGILLWGWQVASYYLGFVTGPEGSVPFPAVPRNQQFPLWHRFRNVFRASAHHELLAVLFLVVMALLSFDAAHRWGLWVYLTLWSMHGLARLNVFFGVRNFRFEMLPAHLHRLDQFVNKKAHNPLSAAIVIFGCVAVLVLIYQGIVPAAGPTQRIGAWVLGTLILLGVVENLLLVLPVNFVLWGWRTRPLPVGERPDASRQTPAPRTLAPLPERIAKGMGK